MHKGKDFFLFETVIEVIIRINAMKAPTGTLNRDSLINYINEEGINAPEKDDAVPFELGKKRGKVINFIT